MSGFHFHCAMSKIYFPNAALIFAMKPFAIGGTVSVQCSPRKYKKVGSEDHVHIQTGNGIGTRCS